MHLPQRLGLKVYCFIFFWIATSGILSLTLDGAEAYVYYHTMIAFDARSGLLYDLALGSALLTALSLIPVCLYAFGATLRWRGFFQSLFLARIFLDVLGKNYEWQFMKTAFMTSPLVGASVVAFSLLLLFPAYQAHYLYAFGRKAE